MLIIYLAVLGLSLLCVGFLCAWRKELPLTWVLGLLIAGAPYGRGRALEHGFYSWGMQAESLQVEEFSSGLRDLTHGLCTGR